MSIAVRVIRNSIFILFARGAEFISAFFILIAIARYLSVKEYGDYSFIIAYVSSIMALTYFGIQQITIREIAKDKVNANQYLGTAIQLRAVLSIIAALAIMVSVQFMNLPNLMVTAIIIGIFSEFFLTFSMLLKAVFQAFEKMIYEPILALINSLVLLAGIAMGIYLDMGFLWLFIAILISNVIHFIIAVYILSYRFVRPLFNINRAAFRAFLKDSSIIGVGIFFYQNLFRIDVLMLKWLGRTEDVAFFQIPHSLIMHIGVVPASLTVAVFPVFSRLFNNEPSNRDAVFEKVFRCFFILSFIPAMFISLFSQEIIGVVFSSKYAQSVTALMIVAWAIIPLSMDIFLNSILIAMNKQKYSVIYGGVTLAMNFLAALVFIPRYGFIAAAYIALLSYCLLFLCSLYVVARSGLPVVLDKILAKTVLSGLISGLTVFSLKPVSIFLAIPVGIIIYLVLILMMNAFPIDKGSLFKGITGRVWQ